jgi:hypothetical protein
MNDDCEISSFLILLKCTIFSLAFENGVLEFENGVLAFENGVLAFENQALKYLLQGRLTKCLMTLSLGRTYVR